MYVNLSWLKVEERLTSSLLVFVRNVDMLNARGVCLNYKHTARTPMLTPQVMPPKVYSQSPSQEQTMGGTQYCIAPWLHGIR